MSAPVLIPELARRRPVWLALGELYLDTELQAADFQRIAAVCAASGFSWAEIQAINYNEVAPTLFSNLQSVAGEWAGWDEEWVIAQISSHYSPKPHNRLGSTRLWQRMVDFYTKRPLAAIAAYLP